MAARRQSGGVERAQWLLVGASTLAACGLTASPTRPPVPDAGPPLSYDGGALSHLEGDAATDDRNRCGPCGRACEGAEACVAGRCVPGAGATPRLISPASLGRVTSQRPTLRWLLPSGTPEARVQVCRDRACAAVAFTADVAGSSLRPTEALAAGVYFWRVYAKNGATVAATSSATWEFQVRARDGAADTTIGTITDFNGDGYGDLVVGRGSGGRSAQYAGGPQGASRTPTTNFPQLADGSTLPLFSAGDVNGDGYTDMLSLAMTDGELRATLYPGGTPAGTFPTPVALTAADPWSGAVGSAGDVDGDGYGDLLVRDDGRAGPVGQVRIFFGAATGVRPQATVIVQAGPEEATGIVWSGQGDVNGDRLPDFAFGMPSTNDGAGRARVWVNGGCGMGRLVELPGDTGAFAHFGESVSISGDYNGDGYSDVVVTAPHDSDTADRSAAWVFPGSAMGPVGEPRRLPFTGRQTETVRVAVNGDLNGDGFGDLAVWMHTDLRPTEALFYLGSADGLPTTPARSLNSDDYGPNERGFSVSNAGDTDRDGFDDVTVYLSPGRVVLARGTPTGPTTGMLPTFELP